MLCFQVSDPDMAAVVTAVLQYFNVDPDTGLDVLAGKSWGGRQAALLAGDDDEGTAYVVKPKQVVLVSPAWSAKPSMLQRLSIPVLLLWCHDDWVQWVSNVEVFKENVAQLTVHLEGVGGHHIVPAFVPIIVGFVLK